MWEHYPSLAPIYSNGDIGVQLAFEFVKLTERGQHSYITPIYASVVKMDISRNATNVEFGVRILTEAPI